MGRDSHARMTVPSGVHRVTIGTRKPSPESVVLGSTNPHRSLAHTSPQQVFKCNGYFWYSGKNPVVQVQAKFTGMRQPQH